MEVRACSLFRLQVFWKEMVGELWWKFDIVQCGFILVEVLSWNIIKAHLHLLILCYTSRERIALCLIVFLLCISISLHFFRNVLFQKKFFQNIFLMSPRPHKQKRAGHQKMTRTVAFVCSFILKDGEKLFLKKNQLGKDESLKWNPVMLPQTKSKRCLVLAYVTSHVSFTRSCAYTTNNVIPQY